MATESLVQELSQYGKEWQTHRGEAGQYLARLLFLIERVPPDEPVKCVWASFDGGVYYASRSRLVEGRDAIERYLTAMIGERFLLPKAEVAYVARAIEPLRAFIGFAPQFVPTTGEPPFQEEPLPVATRKNLPDWLLRSREIQPDPLVRAREAYWRGDASLSPEDRLRRAEAEASAVRQFAGALRFTARDLRQTAHMRR